MFKQVKVHVVSDDPFKLALIVFQNLSVQFLTNFISVLVILVHQVKFKWEMLLNI